MTKAAKAEGMTPLEYLCDRLRDGVAFLQLAAELAVSRQGLSRYAHSLPDAEEHFDKARTAGTFARLERARETLENAEETPAAIAKAKAIIDHEQWIATRFNQRTFGDKSTVQGTIQHTAGKSFLDAMRVRRMPDAVRVRLIEAPVEPATDIDDAIVEAIDDASDDSTTT